MLGFAGCGGGDSSSSSGGGTGTSGTTTPAAVEFPAGEGRTLRALRSQAPERGIFTLSMSELRVGANRVGFALFDESREALDPEAVAVYVARTDGRGVGGPFEARRESLRVKPQFMSRQTEADLEDIETFWVADGVEFPKPGRYILMAIASYDGKLASTSQLAMRVGADGGPPSVGEKAPAVHTETLADARGDVANIDTRLPPLPELHEDDFADVVGKKPVVLAFATPQLCQVRVCGPVVDVVAEVRSQFPEPTYIHQEIFQDNDVNKGLRKPVVEFGLRTEPWVFLVGPDGKIVERFEGAVSVAEMTAAVEKLTSGS